MNINTDSLLSRVGSIAAQSEKLNSTKTDKACQNESTSFGNLLQKEIKKQDGLTFSKHAETRMSQRDMALDAGEMQKLSQAVDKAGDKGVQNTLVLMDGKAFIVNVPNSVVITAMNGQDLKENVFTNIDGTVII